MSVELPTETLKKLRPQFGNKTFLPLESRAEDNIYIPLKVSIRILSCTIELWKLYRGVSEMGKNASLSARCMCTPHTCRQFHATATAVMQTFGFLISSVVQARVANYKLKELLEINGGMALEEGHVDYKWFCRFRKACEGWY